MATRHNSCPAHDDEGLGDYRSTGAMRADAKRGSKSLLLALLRMAHKSAARPKREYCRYGTWQERKLAHLQVARLQRVLASHFGIPVETMTGPRGPKQIAEKRQIAMYLARAVIRCSYPDIGMCFGGRDHSTVMHACKLVESNPKLSSLATYLRERIVV